MSDDVSKDSKLPEILLRQHHLKHISHHFLRSFITSAFYQCVTLTNLVTYRYFRVNNASMVMS